MARIAILDNNLWAAPASVVTATSAATGLPAGATQNPDRNYIWRSLATTGQVMLTVDLGSALAVSYAFLAQVRRLNNQSVLVQQAGSGSTPGTWTTVGTLPAQDTGTKVTAVILTGAPVTARHWRFLFQTTGASDYCEAGYAGIGAGFVPTVNMSEPMQMQLVDPAVIVQSIDGQASATVRSLYWAGSFEFYKAADADRGSFETFYRNLGLRTPFFMWLDQATGWQAVLARLTGPIGVMEEVASPLLWTLTMDWAEER